MHYTNASRNIGIMSNTSSRQSRGRVSGRARIGIAFSFLLLGFLAASISAQQKPSDAQNPDDVIRVSTKLVQTGVTVTDKKGRFVDNLSRDDFELLVDGKPQPISLFEVFKSPALFPDLASSGTSAAIATGEEATGRAVLFFIDDLHLSAESIGRTRKLLDYYIDQQIGYGDQVLIASPSGEIGFLQQLTDSREALHAAVTRLKFRSTTARDGDRPPMSEYQALSIERGDEQQLNHFASIALAEVFSGMRRSNAAAARDAAERVVHTRARRILAQSSNIARATLSTLENLMRSVGQLPGRKLVVMVSDGFLLNNQAIEVSDKLRDISDAALRADTVIYSIQASGLNTSFPDAASTDTMDSEGNTGRAPLGEDTAMQAPLSELAAETGGRAFFNANDLNPALNRALNETAQYYLVAWRPDEDLLRERKFHRIKVILKAHSDLLVHVNSGFFSEAVPRTPEASATRSANTAPQEELRTAIASVFHTNLLQTSLTINYMESPAGPRLTILLQVPLDDTDESDRKRRGADIVGVVLDDTGKTAGSFGDHLTANSSTISISMSRRRSITYLNQVIVKPGLYEVRVAARDSTSGNIGCATRWIEVPNIASGRLGMSSLLLGERDNALAPNADVAKTRAQLKVDNHFSRKSHLRMLVYLYNAASAGASPQVDVEMQLLRQNKVLVSSAPRRLEITTVDDKREFPFMEEISLASIASGRYVLRVIATDRLGKKSVSREAAFQVE